MRSAPPATPGEDWRKLTSFGEQLRNEDSLTAQRDRIISMTGSLIEGKVEVWLQEKMFRLPDWEAGQVFPAYPSGEAMKRAIKSGKLTTNRRTIKSGSKIASRHTYVAIPLEDQGVAFGALQITRPKGQAFSAAELNLLRGLAQIITAGLIASHRAEVDQFRMRQLNLVRAVSTKIANILDVDELAKQITQLIQMTFNYYYVAIFTVEPDNNALRFKASAVAARRGRKKAAIALEVEIGQGLIGEAAAHGQQVLSDDVRSDPRYRFIDSLPETRSEVVFPLKIEDRVLGILDVQSNVPHAFHPNDLLILEALADNIARAVHGANLYTQLRRRADQLTLVSEVGNRVTSTLDLAGIMRDAAALIHEKFGYSHVALCTVHPNRRLIVCEAASGRRSRKLKGFTIPLDDPTGIMPWVARHGKTILANDVSKDEKYVPSQFPPKNTRSELCVPLKFNEVVIGLLDIQSDRVNSFTKDDQLMCEAVADTMAAAIRNADLYRSEQWRRKTADSLRDVAGLITTNAGVEEVLDTILSELERNLPIDVSAIWLLEDGELCLSAVHGGDADQLESVCLTDPSAAYAMAEALLADLPVIRKPEDPLWPAGLAAGYEGNYSSIAAPLRVGDRPLGVLTLEHHTSGRYGHEAQAITTTFASYAAVAIENARLYDAAQEQAYASAALLQVAQAVVSLTDLNEILGSVIRIMPILVGVNRVALYRWAAERNAFVATHEYGFSENTESSLPLREVSPGAFPLLDFAHERNHLVCHPVIPDAKPASWLEITPTSQSDAAVASAERLVMAVPLSIKNDFFGVMLIEEAPRARRFRARRFEIINGIAQQAALAIQNDLLQQEMVVRERLETEAQLARQIQQTFIPQTLPSHPSWQLAARWRTARQVGGDFYDVIELPNGKLGLFIADVADKGMPAGLFMALTRTLMRAAVIDARSPAEALRRVNDQLLPDTQQGMFVTAVYGVLDTDLGEFTYVNAGHNPPLWVKANGEMEKLTRTGVALGVLEQPSMNERTISLEPGDAILLYTDGVTEAFSAEGDLFGEMRLMEALESIRAGTSDQILAVVEEHLDQFTDPVPLSDDLTMLAIKHV